MGSHNQLIDQYEVKSTKQNLIADPGNGGTVHVTFDDAVCLLTVDSGGQTRLIDSASIIPVGVRITFVLDQLSGGGSCTIEGNLLDEFTRRLALVVTQEAGVKSWALDRAGDDSATSLEGTDVTIDSVNKIKVKFGGASALAIDDAAITGHAATVISPPGVFIASLDGADGGAATEDFGGSAGDITITAGVGGSTEVGDNDGGDSGSITLATQAGGLGSEVPDEEGDPGKPGAIRLLSAGGIFTKQEDPFAETGTTISISAEEMMNGLVTVTQTAAVTATLHLGSLMDPAIPPAIGINEAINWSLINLGSSSGAVTVTPSSGHTVVGDMVVAIGTSALFRTRRTAVNTYVTYRIS
jgi:hypothetical protein